MRLEATVIEGDDARAVLVPLATVLAFKDSHDGRTLNDAIENGDFVDWEPWVTWHAHTARGTPKETRTYEDWAEAVDWCSIRNVNDAADPSGGEANPTRPPSPESSSTPRAPGRSSSTSRTPSKKPSGRK